MVFQQGLSLETLFLCVVYERYYYYLFMRDFILFSLIVPIIFSTRKTRGQRMEIVHGNNIEIGIIFDKIELMSLEMIFAVI